jgi:hypothetical protein
VVVGRLSTRRLGERRSKDPQKKIRETSQGKRKPQQREDILIKPSNQEKHRRTIQRASFHQRIIAFKVCK